MALTSPGVEVTVVDESQYIPSSINSVPYILIATAQNKVAADGVTVAAGTLAVNANKTYLITSQRDLTATFGVPFFYNTTAGTPINGYELNEYGLLAAYSALGISNRCYVQRADIDLSQLTASLTRPTGTRSNNTYWLDTSTSIWGIQEWNSSTSEFTVKTPYVITDTTEVVNYSGGNYTPVTALGSIGDYAVSAVSLFAPVYYKNSTNAWVQLGTDAWKTSWPTVQGTGAPASLTIGNNIEINGTLAQVGATNTVTGFVAVINGLGITGVTAANVDGKLVLYADSTASNDGSTANGGVISIQAGPNPGTLLTQLGISAIEYYAPEYLPSYSYQAPRWRTTDTGPRPTGSVWNNQSPANNGLSLDLKRYDATLGVWISQTVNSYSNDATAIYGLDPSVGGGSIPLGTTYVCFDADRNGSTLPTANFELLNRVATGATIVTGSTVPTTFGVGDAFTIEATQPGTASTTTGTVTIGGTGTVANFLAAVSAANIPYVTATVNSAGNIVLTHTAGGSMAVVNTVNAPLTTAGFTNTTPYCRDNTLTGTGLILSNFVTDPQFTYIVSNTLPTQDPANGRLWYYSAADQADIMIQNNGTWYGYQQVSNDVRGFDLTLTNASGPIFAASAPTTQNDSALSPLQYGDLWIDTSDLENYPKIYRWQQVSAQDQWVAVDTADQVTQNGILFADARWAPNGTTNPISDPIPSIASLLVSSYTDLDAPDPALYPQGMLLWNTRRSGYNVKSFQVNYFNSTTFPDETLPAETNAWVTASGNQADGSMYAGRQAQRQLIVQAMKSGLDASLGAREETTQFNLLATPNYQELVPNMVALSNERNNTAFVIGDTPLRLPASGTDIVTWATNNNGLGLSTGDGLVATSQYEANFWPSCQTTDLSGNLVVQPPSHMMIRTIIRSDEVGYPWLAPAGTRRGVIDNATAIGYINAQTGEFVQVSVNQGLRDVLYQNNVNPITFIPGVGITNFGNKTSTSIVSALDRINVARLVAFLRGRLEEIGKQFLFEPNDQITRAEITNSINSLMIDLIAKRAIYDYLVVCDLSNNTPARIDRNELWVDIAIEPVKAVEFIYIPLRIKNTGEIAASLGGQNNR